MLVPFKEIFTSNVAGFFCKLEKNIVPLSLVGHLLNYVGNHLLHYTYKNAGKRIYLPMHKAMSIHLMGNGEIMTQVLKTEFAILPDHSVNPPSFQVRRGSQQIIYFRSKAVVIAGGAKQGVDARATEWFPGLSPERLIPSDNFLKKEAYLEWVDKLKRVKRPKVVIIGGSHSGFSCAWLLLNGPAMFQRCFKLLDEETVAKQDNRVPFASRKSIKNCLDCC